MISNSEGVILRESDAESKQTALNTSGAKMFGRQPQSSLSLVEPLPPRLSGVYQIRCSATDKIYIGSTVDLQERWNKHRHSLRHGKHRNRYLQTAWNKYGEAAFEFSILELIDPKTLLDAEQNWIDKTGCTDRRKGFNIYPVAGSPGDIHAQQWEGFISPEGNPVTIFNLQAFCREQGLNHASMQRLASGKGKLRSYKGWTHTNNQRQRDYVKTYSGFIDPEGHQVEPITNLAAFCRSRGLDPTHMIAVIKGRICSHRGWTHQNSRPNKHHLRQYTGFISPAGQRVVITNLRAFCQENGLAPVHMHQVKSGKRRSHKGWIWREDAS